MVEINQVQTTPWLLEATKGQGDVLWLLRVILLISNLLTYLQGKTYSENTVICINHLKNTRSEILYHWSTNLTLAQGLLGTKRTAWPTPRSSQDPKRLPPASGLCWTQQSNLSGEGYSAHIEMSDVPQSPGSQGHSAGYDVPASPLIPGLPHSDTAWGDQCTHPDSAYAMCGLPFLVPNCKIWVLHLQEKLWKAASTPSSFCSLGFHKKGSSHCWRLPAFLK